MRFLRVILIMIVASAISVVVSVIAKKALAADDKVEAELQGTAQRINREGPRLIGNGVRLDGATAGPGRSITYLHTYVEASVTGIDKKAFETAMATALRTQVCNSVKSLILKDVAMIYSYRDRSGIPIGSVVVDKSHCK